jgi:hypothetical protein
MSKMSRNHPCQFERLEGRTLLSVALKANTGVALPAATVVAEFTSALSGVVASDFKATVNWGDNTPLTTGVVVATGGGGFAIESGHTYAKAGGYATTTTVVEQGLAPLVLFGSAMVTDLPVTGAITPNIIAVEGISTGQIVLATIVDPNALATASDLVASLPVGGWGDGAPSVPVALALQQIGVTPSTSSAPGQPIFDVLGSHTFRETTSTRPLLPLTLTLGVTTVGGVVTTLKSPLASGIAVLDAPLTSRGGARITGAAGRSTGAVAIGSFLDANADASGADFTTGAGSTVVSWGDGKLTRLTAANFTAKQTAAGVVFSVEAAHTYATAGQYGITIDVTDEAGQTVAILSMASIATSSSHTRSAQKGSTRRDSNSALSARLAETQTHSHDAAIEAITGEIKRLAVHQ